MQEVNYNELRRSLTSRACELLDAGTVNRVLAWKRGILDYDVSPAIFYNKEQLLSELVINDFSAPNLSKYLIEETRRDGRVLVFLKPCDTYSFNQLLGEHRFDREKVTVIGIPCSGMIDNKKLAANTGIAGVKVSDSEVMIETLYDGTVTVPREELLAERCRSCKSKKHAAFDELIGDEGDVTKADRFNEVSAIEALSPEKRFAFWQNELSRCIRCNACRDVCPACTCEKCVFDNPASGIESKAPSDSFEEKLFHIIRAFHVAGRCTDCGECSRVCPQSIPLHLINRKLIKDMNRFWGEYQAGEVVGSVSPLLEYQKDDIEADERGDGDA